MRKKIYIILLLSFILVSFVKVVNKKLFYHHVWEVIDNKNSANSPIFYPINKIALINPNRDDYNKDNFASNFLKKEKVGWNLWNVISNSIFNEKLPIFYPFNPEWYQDYDNGFLKYPVAKKDLDFSNIIDDNNDSIVVLDYGLLGVYGPGADVPLVNDFGEDMIDDNGNYVYPPREHFWYSDKDIVKYKLKYEWIYNKKGKLINKKIVAIAPMVNELNSDGESIGEKILFWVDYGDLEIVLKDYFVTVTKNRKNLILSFSEYFNQNIYRSTIVEKDTNLILKIE